MKKVAKFLRRLANKLDPNRRPKRDFDELDLKVYASFKGVEGEFPLRDLSLRLMEEPADDRPDAARIVLRISKVTWARGEAHYDASNDLLSLFDVHGIQKEVTLRWDQIEIWSEK